MKILLYTFFCFIFFVSIIKVQAAAVDCNDPANKDNIECKFGSITPPSPIVGFAGGDQTGSKGISSFLSNLIILIYSIATVVLIFMLLWGGFEWLISGGDKEHLANAQKRILNAIIAIIIFAAAFAIIAILGQFTGFKFFEGQPK